MPKEEFINDNNNDYGQVFFQWEIPEFIKQQRSLLWYLAAVIVGLGIIIYSIFTVNYLFALIIILATFIIFLKDYVSPGILLFQITEDGIFIGNQFISYDRMKNFYIIYDPPVVKKLFFRLKGFYPIISIPLENKNPLLIRKKLLEYLKEDVEKKHQSIDDQLENIFKL
ncbi:hypothetical protein JW977_04095 [Candidatus Falkowbacteria bacterium]|nr:hypothetical protein [Candidatus Falkowbacteria bacterium]